MVASAASMDFANLGLLAAGLVILVVGAEALVRGASRLAAAFGISPLVIGLTIVAFGTSAPELAVSLKSAWTGNADVALGNVVGSNIFNVLVILGLCATIVPLRVASQLIKLDVPLMMVASGVVWWMASDGRIGRGEGVALFVAIVGYTVLQVVQSRRANAAERAEFAAEFGVRPGGTAIQLLWIVVGLALLILGAQWLVDAAVAIASSFGVDDLVISLTIVAAGTSLPEVATSVMASIKGERDIAVGNVVGSNIFNLLCVLGLTSAIAPGGVAVNPDALAFDIPIMVVVAVVCLPVFLTGGAIARWEGLLFLAFYAAYTAYLVLHAQQSPLTGDIADVFLRVVFPVTALTLLASIAHWVRTRDPQAMP